MITLPGRFARWRQRQKQDEREFRQQVRARNIENASQLSALSDPELIATSPGSPRNTKHEMELTRRLKAAIEDLTTEAVAARKSADRASARILWATVVLVVLTAALVALTVVLASHT